MSWSWVWDTTRSRHGLKPALDVQAFDDVRSAVEDAKDCDLLTLDSAGRIKWRSVPKPRVSCRPTDQ